MSRPNPEEPRMSRTPWYESDNPSTLARGGGWRLGVIIVAVVAFVLVVSAAVWGIRVATSDVQGRGDAVRAKNDGQNRVLASERFEDTYQEILAADRRIDTLADAAAADPGSQVAATNLTGAITYCQGVVGDYNADARKYTSAEFRAADLPAQIDNVAADTDCEPATERTAP